MAKKKEVVINPKSAPADVESGDVNILYHHTLIGSLSDSGQARLETENTVCLHDIGVEYQKHSPETVTIPVYYTVDGTTFTNAGNISGKPGDYFEKEIDISGYAIDVVNWDNADHDAPLEIDGFYYGLNLLMGYIPNTIPQGFDRITVNMSVD